ncbi:MAG: PAS domain S-box protein [Ignavibacteria bacterium]|nr:PAS domain S-box protein [Ignavibacteria bacterium]
MMRDITARKEAEKILELERHLGITLNTVTEMKDICRTVFDVVLQLDGVDWAAVYLVDEKEGGIELLDHRNLPTEFAKRVARFGNDAPQSQRARAQSPTCFRASEATRETRVLYESEGVHAVAVFPIRFENHPVASLSVASKTRDGFPPFVQKALESVAVQLGGSFARANTLDALRRSEARYRGVVESQGELIFRCDDAGRFTFVNDAMCRTLGKEAADMIGNTADVYAYDDDLPTLIVHFEKLLEAPHRVAFETRARTAAGPRWFRWEACAFLDGQRKLVEVQTVGRDVTELAHERNSQSENTSDLVVIASESGHVWFANKACLSTLGCAGTAVQDMPLNEFISGLSPDQFEEMRRSTRLEASTAARGAHITIATSTIFGLDGNIFGFLGLGRDITEMRDHEERDNENRMYEAFGRMASMVSHEIKTL